MAIEPTPTLEPCPFCGGEARHLPGKSGYWIERVICDACHFHLLEMGSHTAVERWNRRAQPAPADGVLEDAARMDWLDQNIFHREMSQWDKTLGGWEGHNMWVMFAPKGAQGSARNILDAARKQGANHEQG